MAFSVKYSKKFQRIGVTATYRVDILSEAGGGVITPHKMGADPFQLKSLGSEKDEEKIVIGSEITFEFVLNKRTGESDYDALFESEYRDHIVRFFNDDTSPLSSDPYLWQGYLQPENMYKSIFESNLHIYLSASDALKDLADYEFLDSGAIVTGRLSGLAILKLCLTNLDQDSQFQYNFKVKLGTKPDGMADADHNALLYVTHDCRRFSKVENGKTEVDSCLTVIQKVLMPYSCQLFQWGGVYYIKNRHEAATYYYTYNWGLVLQGNRAASNDVVNIDTLKFKRDADESLLPPVKEIGLKLLNRNTGDELVGDINDFSVTTPWDFSGFPGADVIDEDPNLHIVLDNDNEGDDRDITLTDDVTLSKITDNDYIKLKFDIYAHVVTPPTYTPTFVITITKPDGNHSSWEETTLLDYWRIYESPNDEVFRITEDGDYNITITFTNSIAATPPYVEDIYIRNFSLIKILSIDGDTYSDISFDAFYRAISTVGKKVKEPQDVYFGDTAGTNDLAALYYSGSNTDEWDRHGISDDLPLLHIYALNYLTNRKAYSKYLILTVKDASDAITPVNYITFDSSTYDIVSLDKSYRTSWVTLHLKERLTGDATIDFLPINMSSVDGEKTTQTTIITSGGGPVDMVYPGAGIALSSGAAWGASITNNSANWDTAYGWGDHALAGYAPTANPTFTGIVKIDDNDSELWINRDAVTDYSIVSFRTADAVNWVIGARESAEASENALSFYSVGKTGGAGNVLTIDYAGKVGFGTTIPTKPVSIETTEVGTQMLVTLTVPNAVNNNSGIDFSVNESDVIIPVSRIAAVYGGVNDIELQFATFNAGGIHVGMILDNDGNLLLNRGLHVGGTSDPGDNNLWIDGTAQEPNFNSGWQGTNWQIQVDGDAEFNNMLIRGGLSVFELIINQLHYQNGGLIIGAGAGKIDAISDATVGAEVMTFHDPEGNNIVPFSEGAIVMVQRVDINRTDVVKKLVRQVDDITGMVVTMTATAGWTPGDPAGDDTGIFEVGDEVVAIGHISDDNLDSCIYMSAIDSGNPFLRVLDDVTTYGKFSLGDKTTIKLQLGNLASLASYDILPVDPGYGLYSDNVYLKGLIQATSGLIGGFTINATEGLYSGAGATRVQMKPGQGFWAGATAFGDAPFRVDQDGSLTAIGVAELGTNSVSVLGALSNVAIRGPDIWENAYDGSNGLNINRLGYNGGSTQYKDLTVWDGKASDKLLVVVGGDTNLIALGNIYNTRELLISMVGSIEQVWGNQFIYAYSGVSDAVILSHDAVATETGTSYVLKKTITLGAYVKPNRTLRIKFDMKASSSISYGQIYQNGSPVGTEQSTSNVNYVTFSEDISGWSESDTIRLYVKSTVGNTASVQNFRVCGIMLTTIQNEITGTNS